MKEKKPIEFAVAAAVNVVLLVGINAWRLWQPWTRGVVLDNFGEILWAANLSFVVQIVGNGLLVLFRPPRLYSFLQAVFALVGLVSIIVLYRVFPLDFSQVVGSWMNLLFRWVLIIGMVGSCIGIVVHLIRALTGTAYKTGSTS
ncbi:MAG TPA: hypothetical protein G4O08_03700 [Anaerolineae bacterium]|nr:hypothetical protein [Anaerolineae bacterium]